MRNAMSDNAISDYKSQYVLEKKCSHPLRSFNYLHFNAAHMYMYVFFWCDIKKTFSYDDDKYVLQFKWPFRSLSLIHLIKHQNSLNGWQFTELYLPRLAVVLPTCPNRFMSGSQNTRSKHSTILLRFPKPNRSMAVCFHCGNGGSKRTVFNWFDSFAMAIFNTPSVNVDRTMSAVD